MSPAERPALDENHAPNEPDLAAEYEAALDGVGLADLAERDVLVASGPNRQGFLQGMLSHDVEACAAGQGCRATLMNARGRVRFLLRVLVEGNAVRLETDAAGLPSLRQALELYRVAAPVRFEHEPTRVLGLLGLEASALLGRMGIAAPTSPEAHARAELAGQEVVVARAGDLPGGGFVLHASPEHAPRAWKALAEAGARPVGREALDARRVEDLRPWYGFDITEENLLHETGLLDELRSTTKGCYVGQEVVARLDARGGHVNKALRRLRLSAPTAPGSPVLAEEKEVGRITTPATSPRYGPIALGWVHRSHFDPGQELSVAGAPATVVEAFDQE
jgi:folate-binding protein YgfZ